MAGLWTLLRRLWRRRVLPVAFAYLALAAVLAPAAILLTARLRLPPWTDEAVLGGLAIFFLPALWLAWSAGAAAQGAVPTSSRNKGATIAVLPFANLSQRPEDEVFADGMVEDLITGLSMSSTLTVISRSSTFAYKNQSTDVRQVAEDLGCDFVLDGSVRRAGDRLRVSVQLIDGASGSPVWTEKYDRPVKDLFGLQDQLMGQIAAALGDAVIDAELQKVQRNPASVSAWEESMRAFLALERPTVDSARVALGHARRAVELDPQFALGHARLGSACMTLGQLAGGEEGAALLRAGSAAIDHALDLAPNDPKVLTLAAGQMGFYGRAEEAIRHGLRARAINPHDSHTVGALANAYFGAGRWAEAAQLYEEEARLSPRAVMVVSHSIVHGIACMMLGDFDRAEAVLRRSLELNPGIEGTYAALAVLRLMRGDAPGAVEAVRGLRQVNPEVSREQMARTIRANVPSDAIERLLEGFHQAWAQADVPAAR